MLPGKGDPWVEWKACRRHGELFNWFDVRAAWRIWKPWSSSRKQKLGKRSALVDAVRLRVRPRVRDGSDWSQIYSIERCLQPLALRASILVTCPSEALMEFVGGN